VARAEGPMFWSFDLNATATGNTRKAEAAVSAGYKRVVIASGTMEQSRSYSTVTAGAIGHIS
jgi:hypothetical protein